VREAGPATGQRKRRGGRPRRWALVCFGASPRGELGPASSEHDVRVVVARNWAEHGNGIGGSRPSSGGPASRVPDDRGWRVSSASGKTGHIFSRRNPRGGEVRPAPLSRPFGVPPRRAGWLDRAFQDQVKGWFGTSPRPWPGMVCLGRNKLRFVAHCPRSNALETQWSCSSMGLVPGFRWCRPIFGREK